MTGSVWPGSTYRNTCQQTLSPTQPKLRSNFYNREGERVPNQRKQIWRDHER
jgi:hypothetical protein